ncbi:Bifunctional protein GlmU [Candidatus Fokinia solitaria]|uniref:Bifunctional protein GlmU n=1 Tax=Candidatus Fokinia solitaria TaxID=1802984 RepID=A0A2U8BRT7_9RICK|nr:NTP transferase domain-containing protein [Candidatus Fokinia solitaria]AWD33064.1 Bifunctional protein GlmU [Candidatus Fokinia solitaria]
MKILVALLCGGRSTRMRSKKPKFMLELAGVPILHHILRTVQDVQIRLISHQVHMDISLVLHHTTIDESEIDAVLDDFPTLQIRKIEQKMAGTGGATLAALSDASEYDDVLVLYGDMPLIKEDTLYEFIQNYRRKRSLKHNFASLHMAFATSNPIGYGVMKTEYENTSRIVGIVEFGSDGMERLPVKKVLCNAGTMMAPLHILQEALTYIQSIRKEYEILLTEVVSVFFGMNMISECEICDQNECINTNNLYDLARAEEEIQDRIREELMMSGVHLIAPRTNFFHYYHNICDKTVIHPYSIIGKNVLIHSDVVILPYCYLEGVIIESDVVVGPFCRIRGETILRRGTKAGNFLELKNSIVGEDTKIGHFGYVGDAIIGHKCNIGAGAVFCNYDGYDKHKTTIKNNAFIGANVSLVAPITVGDRAMIGAGSVVTQNVSDNELAVERNTQKNTRRKRFIK